MAIVYKTAEEVADQYLLRLKALKPEVNINQVDSDWWIRSRVVGGVMAGVYADQTKIANDAFPQSARRDALERHLNLYFDSGFTPATQAVGNVLVTGDAGSVVPFGMQFQYDPNGALYAATEAFTMPAAATGVVPVQSIETGQAQNILEGAVLSIPSPPAGLDPSATVYGGNISDGRNIESNDQASTRILRQVRTPLAGGKVADYIAFALAADPSVTSANILRYAFGFGTVGVVITAGTTDIDTALDNGQPIILVPSDELVDRVQAYIETQDPITDCATVLKPATTPQDAIVRVRFFSGDQNTINSGQTLTQGQLVAREVQRAFYKTPAGGRQLGGQGYVVAADIESLIDLNLAFTPYVVGLKAQIVTDRQVDDLTTTGANRLLLGTEIVVPGTISIVEM